MSFALFLVILLLFLFFFASVHKKCENIFVVCIHTNKIMASDFMSVVENVGDNMIT